MMKTISEARRALVAGVRAFAVTNYERKGWDVVVEAWSDADILETMGNSRTLNGSIARVGSAVRIYNSVREDIRNA